MGLKALQKIQLGRETTAGTPVAATVMWRGEGKLSDRRLIKLVKEDIGQVLPKNRTYVPNLEAEITLSPTPATFEQLPHLLEMGIKTATPVAAGSGYEYSYPFSLTAGGTLKYYTAELGDNSDEDDVEYCFCRDLELTYSPGEAVMLQASLIGRQLTDSSFTSLSVESVEEILAGKTVVYVDASGGTIGTTAITGSVIGASVKVETGFEPLHTLDGNLYFTAPKWVQPRMSGKLLLEHDANGVALVEAAQAETAKLLRLRTEGSALTTTNATYDSKTLVVDCAIRFTKVPDLSEKDGNMTVELEWENVDDSSILPTVIVVNNKASL